MLPTGDNVPGEKSVPADDVIIVPNVGPVLRLWCNSLGNFALFDRRGRWLSRVHRAAFQLIGVFVIGVIGFAEAAAVESSAEYAGSDISKTIRIANTADKADKGIDAVIVESGYIPYCTIDIGNLVFKRSTVSGNQYDFPKLGMIGAISISHKDVLGDGFGVEATIDYSGVRSSRIDQRVMNRELLGDVGHINIPHDNARTMGGEELLPANFGLCFLNRNLLTGNVGKFFGDSKLLLARSPKSEGEDRHSDGGNSSKRPVMVIKKFSDYSEDDQKHIISGAIFVSGILGLIAYLLVDRMVRRNEDKKPQNDRGSKKC